VAHGVAAHTALTREADRLRAAGDPRSRGQIMADTLYQRITGQAAAAGVPVEVHLVMTEDTLLRGGDGGDDGDGDGGGGGDEPADLIGAGPLPAPAARDLIRDPDATVWLRRLYTADGALVAMDPRRREFPAPLRRLILVRDQYCRTSWCGAPIRHTDHAKPWADGGPTSDTNGQGLCEACNHAKQAPGWHTRPGPDGAGHQVHTTTPTGHTHTSRPPPLPGPRRPPVPTHPDRRWLEKHHRSVLAKDERSVLEEHVSRLLDVA
jgi:hypothetical protein